jgi:translation initiation factor 1
LPTSGGNFLEVNPFASLSSDGLKAGPSVSPSSAPKPVERKSRGRLDVKREKSGRGGKTVTVVYGMQNIEMREREQLLKKMKNSCGAGGAIKDGNLEVQGDNRETVQQILEEAGFRVVLAGG